MVLDSADSTYSTTPDASSEEQTPDSGDDSQILGFYISALGVRIFYILVGLVNLGGWGAVTSYILCWMLG